MGQKRGKGETCDISVPVDTIWDKKSHFYAELGWGLFFGEIIQSGDDKNMTIASI